jgi:hypothetical protein
MQRLESVIGMTCEERERHSRRSNVQIAKVQFCNAQQSPVPGCWTAQIALEHSATRLKEGVSIGAGCRDEGCCLLA